MAARVACALAIAALAGSLQWLSLGGGGNPAAVEHAPLPDRPMVLVESPVLPVSATPAAPSPTVVSPDEATPGPDLPGYVGGTIYPAIVTDATVVAAAAVHVADGGALTEAQMLELLREAGWPEELLGEALQVSFCESLWHPGARGDGGASLGLFQIGVSRPGWHGWFQYLAEDEALAYDALTNARVAWRIYQYGMERYGYGWGPWSCRP